LFRGLDTTPECKDRQIDWMAWCTVYAVCMSCTSRCKQHKMPTHCPSQ